jgi:predicted ATP-grasp superfamily ATP-dependent carboligase
MTATTPPALVIGGMQNGLGVMRSLGRSGIDVYCLVNDPQDFAIASRYCKGYAAIPSVETDYQVLQRALKTFGQRFPGPIYLHPTGDLSVLHLAEMRDHHALSSKYVTTLPEKAVIDTLVVKKNFYQSLQTHHIPHPTTLFIDDPDFTRKLRVLRFPIFIKPSISQRFSQHFPGTKGFVAHNERELHHYLGRVRHHNLDVIIQQIIVGPSPNNVAICGYFNKHHRPIIVVARQRIRQPSTFSVHSIVVSIPITVVSELKQLIVHYLSMLRYHGPFSVECKRDDRDQQYRILEVNARSTWPNNHLARIGVNQVLTGYREAVGHAISPKQTYRSGVYSINLIRDLRSIHNQLREGTLSCRDVIQPYLAEKHWLIFARDDPRPFMNIPLNALLTRVRACLHPE